MATPNASPTGTGSSQERRSQRVIFTAAVSVRNQDASGGEPFEEQTQTLVVNAHGALIALSAKIQKGEMLVVKNCATGAEQACQVTYLGPLLDGKTQVGIEFAKRATGFWQIAFPPEDWRAPEEAPGVGKP